MCICNAPLKTTPSVSVRLVYMQHKRGDPRWISHSITIKRNYGRCLDCIWIDKAHLILNNRPHVFGLYILILLKRDQLLLICGREVMFRNVQR